MIFLRGFHISRCLFFDIYARFVIIIFINTRIFIFSMDLRELKKEVQKLGDTHKNVEGLHNNWLRHVKEGRNNFIAHNSLPILIRKKVGQKVASATEHLEKMRMVQMLNEKLASNTRWLIDLKLAQFQGDKTKAKMVSRRLVEDNVASIKTIAAEIQSFENSVQQFSEIYQEVNELLHKQLSLEEVLFLMDLPHRMYIHNLLKTSQQHKAIIRDLNRHFVEITTQMSLKNVRRS